MKDLKGVAPDVRRAIEYVLALGWRYKILQNNHIMLLAPDGKGKVTASCTPSETAFIYKKIIGDVNREIRRCAS